MCHHCLPPLFPPAVPGGCLRSSSQPRASFYFFSLLALLRPRLGGIEFFWCPGTCPTNAIIFSQVKGCRLIGVCSVSSVGRLPSLEMILKRNQGLSRIVYATVRTPTSELRREEGGHETGGIESWCFKLRDVCPEEDFASPLGVIFFTL